MGHLRSKDMLFGGFDDISILNRYLYMSDTHFVEFNNNVTTLHIRMSSDLRYFVKNTLFPDVCELEENLSLSQLLNIISQLKNEKCDFYGNVISKWDKIVEVTRANLALNKNIGGIQW